MMFIRTRAVRVLLAALAVSAMPAYGPSLAQAQTGGRSFLRQIYGELAVDVRSAPGNALRIGVANGRSSLTITVLARDLRRWADSASRVLAARRVAGGDTTRFQAVIEGPGVSAGSMTLSRTITAKDTVVSFFVADAEFRTVRTVVDDDEARTLVAAMRRAANAMLSPPRRGRGAGAASGRPASERSELPP